MENKIKNWKNWRKDVIEIVVVIGLLLLTAIMMSFLLLKTIDPKSLGEKLIILAVPAAIFVFLIEKNQHKKLTNFLLKRFNLD